ncbi:MULTISPECIES: hypothetical protein [Mycolicibacterium]|jgi:hypothetical protein|uniref:hypothetical protein n=1 Tax=Mycolicibacterium monacense TaxID=85693 RepID=UPI001845BD84|nr:hypothetical protein [Mycolicibacterium monacense]
MISAAAGCAASWIAADMSSLLGDCCSSSGVHPKRFGGSGVDDGFDRGVQRRARRASSQRGSSCRELLSEPLNFFMSSTVDLVKSLAGMPDQLGGLFDS